MKVLGITVPIFTTDFEMTVKDYETLMGESTQKKFDIPYYRNISCEN